MAMRLCFFKHRRFFFLYQTQLRHESLGGLSKHLWRKHVLFERGSGRWRNRIYIPSCSRGFLLISAILDLSRTLGSNQQCTRVMNIIGQYSPCALLSSINQCFVLHNNGIVFVQCSSCKLSAELKLQIAIIILIFDLEKHSLQLA